MATLGSTIALPSGVLIRSVRPEDADELVAYFLEITAQSDNLTFEPDESAMFADERLFLETLEASDNSLALIALDAGKIVGSITFMGGKRQKTAHSGEFGISVANGHWGRGIGSALLQAMIEWARTVPIGKISLEVRIDNERAIALYRKFGFIDEGVGRHVLKIGDAYVDLLCMGLCLGEDTPKRMIEVPATARISLSQPVTIREMQVPDAQSVLDCANRIANETPFLELGPEGLGLSVAEEQLVLSRYLNAQRRLYLGATTADGELVGLLACAAGERKRTRHACQFSLMVLDAYRSNGIGSALLRRMIQWADRNGIHRIALHVHAQNRRAIALYERFGFVFEARILRFFLQDGCYHDAIQMALLLPGT